MKTDYEAGVLVFIMGALGIIVSYIVGELNTKGALIDEMVTGSITITDIQAVIIVIFLLVGLAIGARR